MRKITQVLGTIGLLMPSLAFAVGLGDIRVHSSLNQRLSAQVPIVDLGSVAMDSVNAQLASVAQFKLVGLSRDPNLSKLRFNILRSENGKAYVQINSTSPISDPVMTFLVNLTWPNGQMMREYTVFLDPVSYTRKTSEKLKPAKAGTQETSAQAKKSQAITAQETYGPTTSSDDLWAIAKKTRQSGTSIQQNMVAIYKKNPQAFTRDNINGLRAGYSLTLPSSNEVKAMSTSDSIQYLKQQDKAWHDHSSSSKQHSVTTLPEDLKAKSPEQPPANINTAPEEINLVPESQLSQEGDEFKQGQGQNNFLPKTSTEKALGDESQASIKASSQANQTLSKELVSLQKQLIEKDREILTLEKLLSDQSGNATPENGSGNQAAGNIPQNIDQIVQSQSAPQGGTIDVSYGLPWYAFPLLFFIVIGSLIAGVFIQKRRMQGGFQEGTKEGVVDINTLTTTPFEEKIPEPITKEDESEPTQVESVEVESVPEEKKEEVEESKAMHKAEDLINQGMYQQAIDMLLKLQRQQGKQFDTSVKLLEVFGLAKQKENFMSCYKSLENDNLTGTEKSILDSVTSVFPDVVAPQVEPKQETVSELEPKQPEEVVPSVSTTPYHEEPEEVVAVDFDSNSEPAVQEVVSFDDEPQQQEPLDTIEFESGLGQQFKQVKVKETLDDKENIDDQVWDQMLQNLSVVDVDENTQIPAESEGGDSVESTESPSESEPDIIEPKQEDLDTQLDLAKAYIEMGDNQEAKEILQHIIESGSEEQVSQAQNLLERIK